MDNVGASATNPNSRRHAAASSIRSGPPFGDDQSLPIKDQDCLLPIANVGRIMKRILPANAKISKESKETMQECVSEFIGFVTGEASDRCQQEKRKTVNGDDVCWALRSLGFDEYAEAVKRYLEKYREAEGERANRNSILEDPTVEKGSTNPSEPFCLDLMESEKDAGLW